VRKLFTLLFSMMFLSGCIIAEAGQLQPLQNEPEDAVYEWMSRQPDSVAYSTAIRQISQSAPFQAPVLVSFNPNGWQAPTPALALFEVELNQNKWISTGNDYDHNPDWASNSLSLHSHQADSQAKWSAAYGWITDPQATYVALVWNDGVVERLTIENNTFLSIRTDNIKAYGTEVTALDAEGKQLAHYMIKLLAQG
jgi:hypothetical protein